MRYDPEPANCDMIKGQHGRSSNKYRPPSHSILSPFQLVYSAFVKDCCRYGDTNNDKLLS